MDISIINLVTKYTLYTFFQELYYMYTSMDIYI